MATGGFKKGKKGGHDSGGGISEHAILILVIFLMVAFFLYPVVFKGGEFDLGGLNIFKDKPNWLTTLAFVWHSRLMPLYIFIDAVLILIGIYGCVKYWPMRARVTLFEKPTTLARKKKKDPLILKYWDIIVKKIQTGTPENLRLAVLEADALVDYFLKKSGYAGEHMADRLARITPSEVKSLEKVWQAHRLRNDLVHTPGFIISANEARQALIAYRQFLIELDAF